MSISKEDYNTALQVQGAGNLAGVIHSFSAILDKIWEEARVKGLGIEYVNRHPICILFAEKISNLTKGQRIAMNHTEAYQACRERSK